MKKENSFEGETESSPFGELFPIFFIWFPAMTLGRSFQTLGAMALSAVVVSTAMTVPDRMQLTPVMKAKDWSKTTLIPLKFTIGVEELETKNAQDVIAQHMGPDGSIAFVVRRPG